VGNDPFGKKKKRRLTYGKKSKRGGDPVFAQGGPSQTDTSETAEKKGGNTPNTTVEDGRGNREVRSAKKRKARK